MHTVYSMKRSNLADHLVGTIRDMIAQGELHPGERINEVALADRLDVSRTPLREALARLCSEGFVDSVARRGHFVQRPDPGEVAALYGIRLVLDPAALELSGLPSSERLARLRTLNERLADSADPAEAVDVDDAWHMELVAGCPNPILLELIQRFMLRTRPMERKYMSDRSNVRVAVEEHARIIGALEGGDLESAIALLRGNMETAVDPLLEWAEGGSKAKPAEEGSRA